MELHYGNTKGMHGVPLKCRTVKKGSQKGRWYPHGFHHCRPSFMTLRQIDELLGFSSHLYEGVALVEG